MSMRRRLIAWFGALLAWLVWAGPADAHRLDEYLQATRVAIDIDRVALEIDLTPGASMATAVFGWIDTDGDGQLSSAEQTAYAQQVLDSVAVTADGRRGSLVLTDSLFPDLAEMREGTGMVRLRAAATVSSAASGRHVVTLLNSHHPESSVYLANALVPSDDRITIARQQRDPTQHRLTVDYDVAYGMWPSVLLLGGVLAIVAARSGAVYRFLPGRARRAAIRASVPSSRA
jgi:hypothetical protein